MTRLPLPGWPISHCEIVDRRPCPTPTPAKGRVVPVVYDWADEDADVCPPYGIRRVVV